MISGSARLLAAVDAALVRLERAAALAGGGLVFAAMCLTMLEVVGRRLFNTPVPGLIDLFDLAMAGMSLLGAAYCQSLGGHIRMDMLIGRLKGRALWLAEFATTGLALVLILVVLFTSIEHAVRAWQVGDVTVDVLLPTWPSKAVASAAVALLALRLFVNLCGFVRLIADPAAPPLAVPTIETHDDLARAEASETLKALDHRPNARP
ncbi:MAG: TRAP transporter small permease subunit [Rhodospirillaceae bacterium]|nr:TRAP transporter small permease subunit [Rhodospirillaceae bacterium]